VEKNRATIAKLRGRRDRDGGRGRGRGRGTVGERVRVGVCVGGGEGESRGVWTCVWVGERASPGRESRGGREGGGVGSDRTGTGVEDMVGGQLGGCAWGSTCQTVVSRRRSQMGRGDRSGGVNRIGPDRTGLERDAQGASSARCISERSIRYLMPVGRLYWLDRPSVDVGRVTGSPLPG
jgi:hypothetical protein